jgi:hypothetical protein
MPSVPFVLSLYAEPWLCELRERFLVAGHDDHVVDRHIGESLTAIASAVPRMCFRSSWSGSEPRATHNPARPH